jgi:N-acetylglutamate synthase-like GNAT family acetyltransferase
MELRMLTTGTPAYEQMKALRLRVLLQPIGIPPSYINPQKEAADTLIGAFDGEKLVGCCILTPVNATTVQLRQMAVDNDVQRKGVGAAIIAFAEKTAKEKGFRQLIMHARDTVVGFYQRCGYQAFDKPFVEVGIGHQKMQKQLL